jgi:hypothetical protein
MNSKGRALSSCKYKYDHACGSGAGSVCGSIAFEQHAEYNGFEADCIKYGENGSFPNPFSMVGI